MEPSPPIILELSDEAATERLGRRLAEAARPGDIIALGGDLGCGKTTLARAFIRALTNAEEEVPSPTFTLVQSYDCRLGPLWHFDLYRLDKPEDALELGIEDAFGDGVCLIEWPERLGPWLPADHLAVGLEAGPGPAARRARLDGGGAWSRRLEAMFGG